MEKMRIGLCVVTYNRLDYLKQCIDSLNANEWGQAYDCIVSDDGSTQEGYKEYLKQLKNMGITVLDSAKNMGVANNKNKALKEMMRRGCTHIFLMEDDILMKHPKTCLYYIEYGRRTNQQHMNFAWHGPANYKKDGTKRQTVVEGIKVHPNCVGAFSYYTREAIEKVGYFDEDFHNIYEHVEHSYRICESGLCLPFWYFPDYPKSEQLLTEIPNSIEGSVIRKTEEWEDNMANAEGIWRAKHGSWILDDPNRPPY